MREILPIDRFRFSIKAKSLMVLPPYKGGIFRGAFGATFRRIVCGLRKDDCDSCILRGNCLYVSLFTPSPPPDFPDAAKFNSAPPPYVLNPPLTSRQAFRPGEILDFDLVLIGRATDALPYFVYTFTELGNRGIGREKGRFEVLHADLMREGQAIQVYDGGTRTLLALPAPEGHASKDQENGIRRLTIRLLTPLRMKAENDLVTRLTFPLFFARLAQRITLLSAFYGNGKPLMDFQPLSRKADQIKVAGSRLHWYDWARYSARQKALMKLGGLKGTITFEGELGPFMPLLRLAEQVNVGQGTTFGLGRIRLNEQTRG